MNTTLDSRQLNLKDKFASFANTNLAALAENQEKLKSEQKELFSKLGQEGLLGLSTAKEYGGTGGDFIDTIMLVESIAKYDPGLAVGLSNHLTVMGIIEHFGDDRQKSRYLPLLAQGELIALFSTTEEAAGTDFQAVSTSVKKDSQKLVLNGKKSWVINAGIAGLGLILAKDENEALKLCLVDLNDAKVKASQDISRLGLHSAHVANLEFSNCPTESILEADGKDAVLAAFDIAKTIIAATCCGITQRILEEAAKHSNTRNQFGKALGQYQGIQWKLADISTEAAGSQLKTYEAAWSKNHDQDNFRKNAAMAKLFASKTARNASQEGVQIMGTSGLTAESIMERLYRDTKMLELCQTTSEYQKILLVDELGI